MQQLANKIALVTGASAGIGRATAKIFAAEGCAVIVGARRQAALDSLVAEITDAGGDATALAGDVTEELYSKALVDLAVQTYGGLDIAINNAGTLGRGGDTVDVSQEAWEHTLKTNLTSAFLGVKYQVPAMKDRGAGSVVFTSSFVGFTNGMPGMAAYSASKAGLVGLARSLAAEYGAEGIRVNALLPGGTDTDMAREFADTPEALDFVRSLHALKRIADPAELAKAALFLASDAASFVTGTAMMVDGGVSFAKV